MHGFAGIAHIVAAERLAFAVRVAKLSCSALLGSVIHTIAFFASVFYSVAADGRAWFAFAVLAYGVSEATVPKRYSMPVS